MLGNKKLNKNNSGFTLIELIVTVVILALVTAPFLSSFVSASNTNVKSRRIEVANEISQEVIERFKGSEISYIKSVYGMTDTTDSSGNIISTATVDCNSGVITGYKGYTAEIALQTSASAANGNNTPVIDNVDKDSCAFISSNLFKYDSTYTTTNPSVRRIVNITASYDDGTIDPSNLGYHIKVEVTYKDSSTVIGTGSTLEIPISNFPVIYIVYKPLSTLDEIHISNNIPESMCTGNGKLPIYLVNQTSYNTTISEANVYIKEDTSEYNLKNYNHESGVYAADLRKTTINTNMITTVNTGVVGINEVVRMVDEDYLYELNVTVKYKGKDISTFTATKNTAD
jgi:prepilin-type N-terminal cleavage/methylation domain-containing protein